MPIDTSTAAEAPVSAALPDDYRYDDYHADAGVDGDDPVASSGHIEDGDDAVPVPVNFVKWTAIPPILEQALGNGIQCSFLMKRNGALLSLAGDEDKATVMSGIMSNVWNSYRLDGHDAVKATVLKNMMIACEDGNVYVVAIGYFLLAACANKDVPDGMLRAKLSAVANYLRKPLLSVYQQ